MNLKRFFCTSNSSVGKYSAIDIAKYVVIKCVKDNAPISNLQLQKILYFIQLHFIRDKGYVLFIDDIEAWQYGPVVPNVYKRYFLFAAADLYEYEKPNIDFTPEEKQFMDEIITKKRALRPWELVESTHAKGKAWDRIYRNGLGKHNIIPKGVIAKYG